MPVTVYEKFGSGESTEGDNASVDLLYVVQGTADDLEAKQALATAAPVLYDGLVRQSWHVEPIGDGLWDGSVRYGQADTDVDHSSFSFDTGGGSQHITQSLATVARYAVDGPAPDFHGAIGVTLDSVEGIDITVPTYHFSETHYFAPAVITGAYKATLFGLTGRVNAAMFRGFAIGEVLFLGASGSQRGNDNWEITYRFAASPNVTGLAVGEITGIAKKGWEYLWVRYADAEDDDAKTLVKRPVAAFVEQVYHYGNFAGLGIGS